MPEKLSVEMLGESLRYTTCLEYLGIHIVDIKNTKQYRKKTGNEKEDRILSLMDGYFGPESVNVIKFTVPESSELELTDESTKEIIQNMSYHTSEDLIKIMKKVFLDDISMLGATDEMKSNQDFRTYLEGTAKFYAKVRKGDVWDNEKADAVVQKILSELRTLTGYKEV